MRLKNYDIDSLLDLAEIRGLYIIPDNEIEELTNNNKELFEETVERILDTLYFGIDLYFIKEKSLKSLALEPDLDADKNTFFNSWSSISALVAALRPSCRNDALKGIAPDFTDESKFKVREIA